MKVAGDMGKVMALMPLTDSDEYRAAARGADAPDDVLSLLSLGGEP